MTNLRAVGGLAVALGGLVLASCSHAQDGPTFKINAATAFACDEVCRGVRLDVTVENPSSAPVCFSMRYIARPSSALMLFPAGETSTDNFNANPDPLDSVLDVPNGEIPYAEMLRAEPNIFVKPGSALKFEAVTGEQYAIPKGNEIEVSFPMYLYRCDGGPPQRIQQTTRLEFE